MLRSATRPLNNRILVRAERLIAITAVALTAFGFAQPQVMSLAGLDFARMSHVAAQNIDPMPTGSLKSDGPTSAAIHGLAGTLKPLRGRD